MGGGSFISSKKPISAEFLREMLKPGLLIKAQYYEDAKYYPAIIDDFLPDGKILVTFSDYGNQEKVALGGIRLIEERQTHQGYQSKIEREILDQERRQATAKGKDYTRRPTGVSTAITMNLQPSLGKKRDEFASPNREDVIVVQSSMTNKEENVPKKKYKMSEEARSRLKALKEKYGDASSKIDSNQL